MSTRRLLLAAGLLVASVLSVQSAALPASAAADPCAGPITESVTLTADAPCTLDIAGSGITVNLGGFRAYSAYIGGDSVVLRNGTVEGAQFYLVYIDGYGATLDRLRLNGGSGWAVEAGAYTTIRRSVFTGVAGVAADQYFGPGLVIDNSKFVDNEIGVSIQSGTDAVIRSSRFYGNGVGVNIWDEDGIGSDGTQILNNRFQSNDVGIRINAYAGGNDTVIRGNVVKGSGASGILVTSEGGAQQEDGSAGGALRTVIERNTVQGSGRVPQSVGACSAGGEAATCFTTADDGITVLAPPEIAATMTVTANKTRNNQGHGIEAPNVIDGGGNVAKHNLGGTCVGVTCG